MHDIIISKPTHILWICTDASPPLPPPPPKHLIASYSNDIQSCAVNMHAFMACTHPREYITAPLTME